MQTAVEIYQNFCVTICISLQFMNATLMKEQLISSLFVPSSNIQAVIK